MEGGEETYERYDVRRVGNDGDSNLGEISLDLSDVALLLLTISKVLPLVSDGSASSGSSRRRNRSSLRATRVHISLCEKIRAIHKRTKMKPGA